MIELDIVMPVYNEGGNIRSVVAALITHVSTPFRLLICYDFPEDDTLPALFEIDFGKHKLSLVKNRGKGVSGAIVSGLEDSRASHILVMPADDDYNADRLDAMVALLKEGFDIVTPCRFMPGGCFKGCNMLKRVLTWGAALVLRYVARLPTRDATNGFRMFSRRIIDTFSIESKVGFAYSLELLVKGHRKGLKVAEYPVLWLERSVGQSRFRTLHWISQYLVWLRYALVTTYLFRRR